MSTPLRIIGYGAVTAVGFDAPQTCAAVRAGLTGFRKSGFFLYRPKLTPVIGAPAPYDVPARADSPFLRLSRMAGDAVKECITGAALDPARTAILFGIRELSAEPGGERQNHRLLALVGRACGATFHGLSEVLPDGNCAIATGLIRAARLLAAGEVECCIVGGVDSYLTHEDIERYDRLARVKNRNNGRGFIPGEAATVVAVALHGRHRSLNAIEPTILGVGVAREEQSRTALSDGHPNGRAVQEALLTAVDDARVDEQALAFRVADLNGERYGCQDSILGAHRFYRSYRKQMPIIFPAASVGETGAAAGALGVIIAAVAMTKGYAPGNLAMCEAASDGGLRSGVVVGAADRERV